MNTEGTDSVSIFDFSLQITNSRAQSHTCPDTNFYILSCGKGHFNLFFQYILQARETSMIYLLFQTMLQMGHNIPLFHDKLAQSLLSSFYSFWGTLNLNGFKIVPMDSRFEKNFFIFEFLFNLEPLSSMIRIKRGSNLAWNNSLPDWNNSISILII